MDLYETPLAQTPSSKRAPGELSDAVARGDPRRQARRRTCNPGAESGSGNFAFMAEAVATLAPDYYDPTPQEPMKAAASDATGAIVPREFRRQEPEEELLVAEVQRIRAAGISDDYRRVLDLHPGECWELSTIQSRYRSLMRLLHPDKRAAAAEARAGGRECCDEAIAILQRAVEQAKQELGKDMDPQMRAQQDMRRMQEIQRTRARQAMQRHHQSQPTSLAADIDRALAEGAPSTRSQFSATAHTQPDPTSQKIMEALAQLTPGKHGAAAGSLAVASPASQPSSTTLSLEQALHETLRRVSSW